MSKIEKEVTAFERFNKVLEATNKLVVSINSSMKQLENVTPGAARFGLDPKTLQDYSAKLSEVKTGLREVIALRDKIASNKDMLPTGPGLQQLKTLEQTAKGYKATISAITKDIERATGLQSTGMVVSGRKKAYSFTDDAKAGEQFNGVMTLVDRNLKSVKASKEALINLPKSSSLFGGDPKALQQQLAQLTLAEAHLQDIKKSQSTIFNAPFINKKDMTQTLKVVKAEVNEIVNTVSGMSGAINEQLAVGKRAADSFLVPSKSRKPGTMDTMTQISTLEGASTKSAEGLAKVERQLKQLQGIRSKADILGLDTTKLDEAEKKLLNTKTILTDVHAISSKAATTQQQNNQYYQLTEAEIKQVDAQAKKWENTTRSTNKLLKEQKALIAQDVPYLKELGTKVEKKVYTTATQAGVDRGPATVMAKKAVAYATEMGAQNYYTNKLSVEPAGLDKSGKQLYNVRMVALDANEKAMKLKLTMDEFGNVIGKANGLANKLNTNFDYMNEKVKRVVQTGRGLPPSGTTNIPHPTGADVGDNMPPPPPPGGYPPPPEPEQPPWFNQLSKTKPIFSDDQLQKLGAQYQSAFEYAAGVGFKNTDLRKVFEQVGGTSNTGFKFEQLDQATGAMRSLSITVDKFGRVVPEVSRRFRSFTQGIVRDLRELTKWTIAISLIYGPMNALRGLMDAMVENESKLADATIAVNNTMIDQATIFNVVSESAQKAGEGITGVIDAFVLAYRATGGMKDETQRLAVSQKLLNDALVLSKLSGMGQAEAIDTLAAALRQVGGNLEGTGDSLTKGTQLLDKWVRVSQVANVDLMTLATGFSILGETADSAGMSIDELNATVAVIAESTPYSGREAANSVRYMLGGYQSQTATAELDRYGVSVVDTTGKVRGFLDVMKQLSDMKKLGIIDKEAFNTISNALGGGPRGAARFQAFIESFDRVGQIAKESFNAGGESAQAMAVKLDTVQTALTRFSNAMQGLAQSLGNQGGLLDIFKGIVDFGTILVTVLDKVIQLTGKAAPALLALGVASLLIGRNTPEVRSNMLQSFSMGIASKLSPVRSKTRPGFTNTLNQADLDEQLAWDKRQRLSDRISAGITSKGAGIAYGMATVALPAIMNAQQGNTPAAVADLVGGLIGASIATLAGSPMLAPVGAAVGASIGEAFVAKVFTYKADFAAFFGGKGGITYGETPQTGGPKTREELEKMVFDAVGGKAAATQLTSSEYNKIQEKEIELRKQGYKDVGGELEKVMRFVSGEPKKLVGPKGDIVTITQPTGAEYTYAAAMEELKRRDPRKAAEVATAQARSDAESGVASPLLTRQAGLKQTDTTMLEQMARQERERLMNQMIQGEITTGEFGKRTEGLKAAPEIATGWMASFGQKFIEISKDVDNSTEAYAEFIKVISSGSPEGVSYINSMVTEMASLEAQIKAAKEFNIPITITVNGKEMQVGIAEAEKLLAEATGSTSQMMTTISTEIDFNKLNLPNIVGSVTEPTKRADHNKIMEDAYKLQEEYGNEVGMTTGQLEEWKSRMEDFVVLTEEAGKVEYTKAKKLEERWYNAAREQLLEKGAITDTSKGMGFQTYDVTREQLNAAAAQSIGMAAQWQKDFGYKPDIEQQIAITKDGVTAPITADLQIMQMLLQRLVDINQKQLDGMYNLPDGATFWVPLTAAYYRRQGGTGGGSTTAPMEGSGTGAETTTKTPAETYQDAKARMIEREELADAREKSLSTIVPTEEKLKSIDGADDYYLRHRGDLPATGSAEAAKETTLQQILNWVSQIGGTFSGRGGTFREGPTPVGTGGATGGRLGGDAGGLRNAIPQTNMNTAPAAKVNLNFRNTTTLLVDGRVLASVIKQYLANDLVKASSAYGSSTKNYII